MYIIAGLGNPSDQYAGTRHNIGFSAVTCIADEFDIPMRKYEGKALVGKGYIAGEKVLLVMPQTFMNLSGDSIAPLSKFYKIDVKSELIVIYDDIYLDPGKLRIRPKGSAGGHNGMKDIIKKLGTDEFTRIRIGVGKKPDGYDLANFVLSRFKKEDEDDIRQALDNACGATREIITNGVSSAMNKYN
ncbi:MAG: aminoacyl-tRNA hydrolase [Lachnospiraceae bacterium]|nr:aminoacyl-tRNA hydrolase [Lachnospiraceae bacterium]